MAGLVAMVKCNFKNSLIIHEENIKEIMAVQKSFYVIEIYIHLHKTFVLA